MTPRSVFLDQGTGDFYSFEKQTCQWKPKGNVGLHYSKALEVSKMSTGRELVGKTQIYRANATSTNTNLFLQKASDLKCYVDKHHHGHYLFRDIPPEFIVDVVNLWDPHPVPTTSISIVKENYSIMAESNRGPLIALHKNSCCVQFAIDRKYRETVTILGNFIR